MSMWTYAQRLLFTGTLGLFGFLFFSSPVFAQVAPAQNTSQCQAGTMKCFCMSQNVTPSVSFTLSANENLPTTQCANLCSSDALQGGRWFFQCTQNGVVTAIDQGMVAPPNSGPLPAQASPTLYDIRDCMPGSNICSCPPYVGTIDATTLPSGTDPHGSPAECLAFCQELLMDPAGMPLRAVGGDPTTFAYQCDQMVDGNIQTVYIDTGALNQNITVTSDSQRNSANLRSDSLLQNGAILPNLAIAIPGISRSELLASMEKDENGNLRINLLGVYLVALYNVLLALGALIAVATLVFAGFVWMTSGGNAGQVGKAKDMIKNTLVGLTLLLGAFTIGTFIDPRLVILKGFNLTYVSKIEFIPNETPPNMSLDDSVVNISSVGAPDGGSGHNGVRIYDQTRYPNVSYGRGKNIKDSGCGPTTFAMAVSHLTGTRITPEQVAKSWESVGSCPTIATDLPGYETSCRVCKEGSATCSGGTWGQAFTSSTLGSSLSIKGDAIGTHGQPLSADDKKKILDLLKQGELIASSYKTESGGGHYVLLVGLDGDGNILINNPWGARMQVRNPELYFRTAKSFYHLYR